MGVEGASLRASCSRNSAAYDRAEIVNEAPKFHGDTLVNAMSVDVEEHFQVSAFENRIAKGDWRTLKSRVSQNVDRIFQLFDDTDTKATFFTLGWVAEKIPDLVRTIVAEGHEIASHGYDHTRVSSQTSKEFLSDISRTKKILEDVSGESVAGYRAPSFSIGAETVWAHEALREAGYKYSSSIYPINHDHYGFPSSPRFPFRFSKDGILEIPLTTTTVFGRNWPGAGGGYFRLLPMAYSRWALNRVIKHDKMPAVFYFHPWEIDPDQPRISDISLFTQFRHYVNIGRFERRLTKFLAEYSWDRMDQIFRNAISTD